MPSRGQPVFTDFSLGEVSPKIKGRFDFDRYSKGLETCQNYTVFPQGGITRRDGSLFVAEGTNNAKKSRLIPVVFSRTEAYILELTDLAGSIFRFDPATGNAEKVGAVSLTTPWLEAELGEIDYTVFDESIRLAQKDHAPVRIKRVAFNSWTVINLDDSGELLNPPAVQTPEDTDVTLSATKLPYIDFPDGIFPGVTNKFSININIDLTGVASFNSGTDVTITATGGFTFTAADVGAIFKESNTSTAGINGYWRIKSFTNSTTVVARMLTEANGYSSSLNTRIARWVAWHGARTGFPRTTCEFENRILFAGIPSGNLTPSKELAIYGSETGEFDSFDNGVVFNDLAADSSYEFTLLSRSGSGQIAWMRPSRVLLIGADLAEYRVLGGVSAISVDAKRQAFHGSFFANALEVMNDIYFIQRDRITLRRLEFSDRIDNYVAVDLTTISDEILKNNSESLAYQQNPDSILWVVRSDGKLIGLTISPELSVSAWHNHFIANGTAGTLVESVAVIPDETGQNDRVWIAVKRTINGATKRHIEVLDSGCNTDGAKKYTGVASNILTGLGHLEGELVDALGDGVFLGTFTVSGSQIDVVRTVTNAEVGLHYKSTAITLPVPLQPSSARRFSNIQVRVLRSQALTINGIFVQFLKSGDPSDTAPPVFSGVKDINNLGWDKEASISLVQDQPYDQTILSVSGRILTGD